MVNNAAPEACQRVPRRLDTRWRTGIVNVLVRTLVLINTSQLAIISAAVKACTFRVVASTSETGPQTYESIELAISEGGRTWVHWGELRGGVSCRVTIATSTVLWHWSTGIAARGRKCSHQGEPTMARNLPQCPLKAAAVG